MIGEACTIRTGRVDDRFGQATCEVGADSFLLQVRCDRLGNGLVRGGRALIVHYDERREAYVVEPLAAVDAPAAPVRTPHSETEG